MPLPTAPYRSHLTRGSPYGFVIAPREQLIAVGPWAPIFRLRVARARGNPAHLYHKIYARSSWTFRDAKKPSQGRGYRHGNLC
jgi:hypothetical protein